MVNQRGWPKHTAHTCDTSEDVRGSNGETGQTGGKRVGEEMETPSAGKRDWELVPSGN
jgi:hypothetical protein